MNTPITFDGPRKPVNIVLPVSLNQAWNQLAALRGRTKSDVLGELVVPALDAELTKLMRSKGLAPAEAQ